MTKFNTTKKLISAGFSLLMALVLLVGGTFAWITMSRAPEVTGIKLGISYDGTQWPFELSLDFDPLTNVEHSTWTKDVTFPLTEALLRPITTYNLADWYIAEYDENGNVDGFSLVPDIEDIANKIYVYEDDGHGGQQIKYIEDGNGNEIPMDPNNYIVYYDVWIRAMDDDNDYELRLNNPEQNQDGSFKVDTFEDYFGTFLVNDPTAQLSQDLIINGDDLMSTMRVGFLFYDSYYDAGTETITPIANYNTAYIWEPNGDMHRGLRGDSGAESEYIHLLGTDANIEVSQYGSVATDEKFYYTYVPVKQYGPGQGVEEHVDDVGNTLYYSYAPQPVYMRQGTSAWIDNISLVPATERLLTRNLKKIGEFKTFQSQNNGELTLNTLEASYTDIPAMITLESHMPRKVRVFFWIEGQDIDCWNQVAGGTMYANIEFRGDPIPHPTN